MLIRRYLQRLFKSAKEMAELQDDVQHMGDEYMVDFEDDAEDLLQAGERNLLDTDSDDNDLVRTNALLITVLKLRSY